MNFTNIYYRVYSVRELRDWLIDNVDNGLSLYAIAPTRAYAIINNPCAMDNDPAIVLAFDGDKSIGYSAVFAEEYDRGNTKGRFYWGTTEWIEPEYRGKGVAGKMMRTLKESVDIERYIGLESSIASIKLDKKQGASIELYDKTYFHISSNDTLKGCIRTLFLLHHNRKQLKRLAAYTFQNEYVNFVDSETYNFVEKHGRKDLFLRQQKMLNWILHYSFLIGIHDDDNAKKDLCEFSSSVSEYMMEAIKVYVNKKLVGFYIVSQTNKDRTLRFLYFDETCRNEVFASVTLNLMKKGIEKIHFISDELREFMLKHDIKHLNQKSYINKVSLTLPPNLSIDTNLHIQGGDGDMFC